MAIKCKIVKGREICPKPNLFMAGYLGRQPFVEGFSPEALAVFALMDSDPPLALKNIMATFIDSQVASGNWAIITQFILYGMDTAANSVINWLSSSFDAVNVGSPHTIWSGTGHSGFAGFSPDGATLYVNAGISANDIGLDDFRTGVWLFTNDDSGANILVGAREAATTDTFLQQNPAGNTNIIRVNTNQGTLTFAEPDGDLDEHSLHEVVRPDSANMALWKNGVQLATQATVSNVVSTLNLYDGAFNNNGTASNHMDCNITARHTTINTGFDPVNFYNNLLIMLQSMGVEA